MATVVQAAPTVQNASLTTATVTLANPTGAGNTLVACITTNGGSSNPLVSGITLGGSADHFASVETGNAGVSFGGEIWYDPNCAGGQTAVVVTCTGGSGANPEIYVTVYEVAGTLTADKHVSNPVGGGSQTTWTSTATATTTSANEIYFGCVTGSSNSPVPSVTGVGTWITQSTAAGSFDQVAGYQNASGIGTVTFSGTCAASSYMAVVATFIAPNPPPGQGGPPSLLHPGRGPAMVRTFRSPRSTTTPPLPPYIPDFAQARRSTTWMPGRGPGGLFAKSPGDTSTTRVQAPPGSPFRSLGFYFLNSSGTGDPTALIDGSVPPDKFAHIIIQQYVAGNVPQPGVTSLAQIRAVHPSAKVFAYQDLGGMIGGTPTNGRPTTLVTQQDSAAHEAAFPGDSWNCHAISGGAVIASADFPSMNMANISRASYQAAASQHFASIKADGFDGVFLDDTNMYPGHGMNSANPGPAGANPSVEFLTDASYRDAAVATVAAVAPVARGLGLLVVPNIGLNPWTPAHYSGYTSMLSQGIIDGANREFWMGFPGAYFLTDANWSATVQMLTDAGAASVFMMLNTYALTPQNDAATIVYATASYYLFWNGVTADSAWYNNGQPLSAYYNYVNLGLPQGPAFQTNGGAGPGWMRYYSLGAALVNPSSTAGDTFPLNTPYVDNTGKITSSVQLAPATAMLLTTTATTRSDLGQGKPVTLIYPGRGIGGIRFDQSAKSTTTPQTLTVTATQGTSSTAGMLLRVKVLTGAAAAAAQTGGSLVSSAAVNGNITTTVTGSRVYGAITNAGALAAEPLCTLTDNFVDVPNSEDYASFRTTSATGTPGSTLVGATGTASFPGLAAQEILASGTITEDASGPAAVTTSTLTALTSALFAPPPGSLIVVMIACNGTGSGSAETCTVTGGGLTWTQTAHTVAAASLYAGVWIADFPVSVGGPATGTAAAAGAGSVTAVVTQIAPATAAGAGSVTAVATVIAPATAAGAGSVTAVATQIAPAAGAGAGAASDVVTQIATAAGAGAGAVTDVVTQGATATAAGAGAATAAANYTGTSSPAGAGSVTDVVTQIAPAAAAGAGAVADTAVQIAPATAAGAGTVSDVITQLAPAAAAGAGAVTDAVIQIATAAAAGAGAATAIGSAGGSGTAGAAGAGAVTDVVTQIAPATAAGAGAVTDAVTQIATATAAGAGAGAAVATQIAPVLSAGAGAVTDAVTQIATATAAGAGSVTNAVTQVATATATGAGAVTDAVTQIATAAAAGAAAAAAIGSTGGSGTAAAAGAGAVTDVVTQLATAAAAGAGAATAAATQITAGTPAGAGSVTDVVTQIAPAAAAGAGAVTAAGTVSGQSTATAAGAGAVTNSVTQIAPATAAGAGAVTAAATQIAPATAAGAGSVTDAVTQAAKATAAGAGAVNASGVIPGTASITGAAAATATATQAVTATAAGAGTLAALAVQAANAALAATGSVTAAGANQPAVVIAQVTVTVTDPRDGTSMVSGATGTGQVS